MKRISDQSKKLILNVVEYFENENEGNSHHQAIEKASIALKVAKSTIYDLKKPGRASDTEYKENMAQKVAAVKTKIDPWMLNHIREVIYKMYAEKITVNTKNVHQRIKEEFPEFCCSVSSIRKWMVKIGFKFRRENNRNHLMELPDIRLKRLSFLDSYRKAKKENIFQPVFLDETWIFSKSSDRRVWQDGSKLTESKKVGSGSRYVIVHAGNENGFVSNASLIFKCNRKTGDYHDNMNTENFENWFKTKLVPNLDQPSLIIMDNASYHSRLEEVIPRKSWTKKRLVQWLVEKGKEIDQTWKKHNVWEEVCKVNFPKKLYHLDNYAQSWGHQVLRLAPYHCHFNAIEMVWSETKRKYDEEIKHTNSSPTEVLATWNKVIDSIPAEHWKNYVTHTEKVIENASQTESLLDVMDIEPLIINISEDSTDNSEFEDEESDLSDCD